MQYPILQIPIREPLKQLTVFRDSLTVEMVPNELRVRMEVQPISGLVAADAPLSTMQLHPALV